MVGIILASHGGFAEGIFESGQMIFGEQKNVAHAILKPGEGPDDFHAKLEKAVDSLDDSDQVLFLIDLWGGTPFNQASTMVKEHEDKWAIVTGMNLPMVLEAYGTRLGGEESAHKIATHLVNVAKDGVKTLPESLAPKAAAPKADKKADDKSADKDKQEPTGTIAPGTVLGDGHIKYVFARIDGRLLHGQVATVWTPMFKPDRIIVVSDSVCKNKLRVQMIKNAAPAGTHAHVVPLKKMVEVSKDPRFGNTRALLLFETAEDADAAKKAGIDFKKLNVGTMSFKKGDVSLTKDISMNQEDVDAIKDLRDRGVTFDVRAVAADTPHDMDKLLEEAQTKLDQQKN